MRRKGSTAPVYISISTCFGRPPSSLSKSTGAHANPHLHQANFVSASFTIHESLDHAAYPPQPALLFFGRLATTRTMQVQPHGQAMATWWKFEEQT